MKNYRVWLRSTPGFYAQYNGYVDVYCEDEEQAALKAVLKLKKTSFSDRSTSMWAIQKIELISTFKL